MKCQNCGVVGEAGARFCASCGAPFQTVADERRVATVLFADLVGFTALSESLDPERVKVLIDSAFERLVDDVHAFGGRVDKIIGDAIVALFGAPVAHEDDPERAVRTGLAMQRTLAAFSESVGIGIRMRVGINTGEVVVGALRAGGDYTAMGDVVNTASRLQTSAAPGEVLVGPITHQATEDSILYEPRGSVIVRGRAGAIDVFAAIKATEAPGFRRRRQTPMVGRESEMTVVGEALRLAVRHSRPTVVLLLGEAGVGKTRLANEVTPLVDELDPGALHLSGRCVPYGESNPWWPIADALRGLLEVAEDDPVEVAAAKTAENVGRAAPDPEEAEATVSGLLHVMGYDSPLRDLDPAKARAQAIAALVATIERRHPDRPVVVRLADLHWASDSVFEFIDALLERVSRRSFIVVATARASLLERWTPPAVRGTSVVLQLDPLDDAASARLIDALVNRPISDEVRAALVERGGGNPFFLEELATLFDAGNDPSSTAVVDLPDTLRGLIAARLDRLTADQLHVVEDAAVWGPSGPAFALAEIARVTRSIPDVSDEIRSLVDLDIFELIDVGWSFRSDLVREVAYNRITKSERFARHLGIARYMADTRPGRFVDDRLVDIVARHFAEASRLGADIGADDRDVLDRDALAWLQESARRAQVSGALLHARSTLDEAIAVCERMSGDEGRARELMVLRLARGRVLLERWESSPARADAEWARVAAAESGDEEIEISALCLLGEIANRDNRLDVGREMLEEARRRALEIGDRGTLAHALRVIAMGELFSGNLVEAEAAVLESLGVYREIGDRHGEAWALQNLAWIAFALGQDERAEARLVDSEAAFAEMGDRAGRSWALGLLAFVRFHQGRFAEARALGEQVVVEAERRGDRWAHAMVLIVLANVDLWEGRTRLSVSLAQRAVDLLRPLDEAVGLEQALATAGRAMAMAGDVDGGTELISEAVVLGRRDGSPFRAGSLLSWSVMCQLGRADDIDAAELAEFDHRSADEFGGGDSAAELALAHLQRGDLDHARRLLEGHDPANDRAHMAAVRALVAAAGGDASAADASVARVATVASTYLDRLYALVAAALRQDGGSAERVAEAHALAATTEDVFARLLVDTLEVALDPDGGDTEWAHLTDRWMEAGGDIAGWARVIDLALATTPAR